MTAPRPSFQADHPASERQRQAADPLASTWLSANAGSGKTRVLTDRVARLLLAGVDPANILCLTYTKAAAAEMQTRLFKRLGGWAMKEDGRLIEELRGLGLTEGLEPVNLQEARRLFAQALETPGGLKIQTIHAFCASLLRRFPLEAEVSPQFRELDDRGMALLRAEVAEEMAMGPQAPLVDAVARHLSGDAFDRMLEAVAGKRDAFWPCPAEADLRAVLDLPGDACEESLLACIESAERRKLLRDVAELCDAGGVNDQKAATALLAVCGHSPFRLDSLADLEKLFLYGESAEKSGPFTAKIGAFPTKALRGKAPDLIERLEALMRDVEAGRDLRLCLQAHARNRDLHAFAAAFVEAYERRKLARGLLDFDDLIARARRLLTDPAVAQWVLWRLDGGIDHILVDEAQDTSPGQWAVIERLAEEFAAGEGRDPQRRRTIFVVGDRKQSIFSFQGADAEGFDRMQAHFRERLGRIGQTLQSTALEYSFRSSEAVLRVVDATFRDHAGLGDEPPRHLAFKAGMPGRVDLWPPIPKTEKDKDDRPWTAPVDSVDPEDASQVLARRIADAVHRMVHHDSLPVEANGVWMRRPVTPGDVMILVQRRGALFSAIIRELKSRNLDVAGADRLKLKGELAVRDIEAVLRVLALPDDSLSLACALKSPLFGWTERQLYRLAQPRPEGQSLWDALRQAGPCEALAILHDLRDKADFLRPYDLVNRLLLRHDGRRRLLARLGPEAEDGIDAFLAQALAYEGEAVPSLTGFLEWRGQDETDVKRQMDAAGDRIRVMTVHGSKGLEAPIVLLPDCASRRPPTLSPLYPLPGRRHVLWACPAADMPRVMRERKAALLAAQEAERRRLLYVAMTRAESWLVVCAAGDCGPESWHGTVRQGLAALEAPEHPFFDEPGGLRYGGWDHLTPIPRPDRQDAPDPTPPVDLAPVPSPPPHVQARAPSDLGGAKILDDEDADQDPEAVRARSLARGHLMHLALEHLPRTSPEAVLSLLAATEEAALAGDLPEIVAEARALIAAPGLAELFGPGSLAEVELSAEVEGLGRLHGLIDRLIVTPEAVTAVDFKTNRLVPDTPEQVPEGILRQLGAYVAMLGALYPGREARTAVLWTRAARLMPLPSALVMAALRRASGPPGPP
ncbi:double-strand break repair helicase AddA [Rubellimicrobium aerolatum]|uniref:DNA 3'-5' helicase n=1 Tax=Rubellimicrobium aerolatum TaxID=490979 RepID=A0ABW0SA89_9RHOB|nr:double-strand break repair helicase AddA [Rubellimicrobium aerolatum]MBP1805133.1 ATP-dependent helicase/nuclease subunit A [Rubellimicrobium aerolatum]